MRQRPHHQVAKLVCGKRVGQLGSDQWRALATPCSQAAPSHASGSEYGLCRYRFDAVSTRPAAETGQCGWRARSRRGFSYEKIAFSRRALLRDGPGSWRLCSARKRCAASGRTSRAQDRQDRLSPGSALSLLVASRLSPLRLWTSSRMAPSPLASRLLAQSSLAPSSSLAKWLLRSSPLLLSLLCAAVLRSHLSSAVCVLHWLVLVVSPTLSK